MTTDTGQVVEASPEQRLPVDSGMRDTESPLCTSPENCGFQMSQTHSSSAAATSTSSPMKSTQMKLDDSNFWQEPCRLCGAPKNKCCC
jgi:hypothetical protein